MRALVDETGGQNGFRHAWSGAGRAIGQRRACKVEFATLVDDATDPVTVVVWGELDLAAIPMFRAAMHDLARQRRDRVVLDLSQLGFIDCTGLRMLLEVCREWTPPGSLVVRDPSPEVRRLVDLTAVGDQLAFTGELHS